MIFAAVSIDVPTNEPIILQTLVHAPRQPIINPFLAGHVHLFRLSVRRNASPINPIRVLFRVILFPPIVRALNSINQIISRYELLVQDVRRPRAERCVT